MSVSEYEHPHVTVYGRGDSAIVQIPSPGPGNGFTKTVPGAVEWCVSSVSFQMVNAGGGGTRTPVLSYQDGSGVPFFQALANNGAIGGITTRYTFANDVSPAGALSAANIVSVIPELRLYATCSIVVTVTGIAAGDVISGIRLFVKQYPIRPD